jgi:hypothetical protein
MKGRTSHYAVALLVALSLANGAANTLESREVHRRPMKNACFLPFGKNATYVGRRIEPSRRRSTAAS